MAEKSWDEMIEESEKSSGNTGDFEPLPDGEYEFLVIESRFQFSRNGKKMWVITGEVQDGPYQRRRVWNNIVLSDDNPDAMRFFFDNMKKMGISKDFFRGHPSNSEVEKALLGRRFRATIGKRVWEGKTSNEIRKFYTSKMVGPGTEEISKPVKVSATTAASPVDDGMPSIPPPF
jgi:hypothetical protein